MDNPVEESYPRQVTHEYAQQNDLQKVSVYIPKPYTPEDGKKGFWVMYVVQLVLSITKYSLSNAAVDTSMEEPGVTRERRWIHLSALDPCS